MFVKYVLLAVFIESVVSSAVTNYGSNDKHPSSVYYSNSCLQAGGLCMEAKECPEGKQSPLKGLCNDKGEVCCYSLPKSETRCRHRGGECWPISSRCPETFDRASDCSKKEKCCMLLN